MSNRIIYTLLASALLGCGDKETPNTPPVASFEYSDGIDRINLDAEISADKDGDALSFQWTTTAPSIVFGNASDGESHFKIPTGASNMNVEVTLRVSDGKSEDVVTRTIDVPAFSEIRSYGLGKSLGNEVSNNVDYDWYIDQDNSGQWSLVNCGPASVTMAIRWFDPTIPGTTLDARNTYHSEGGWWYTKDIIAYLGKFAVDNRTINLSSMSDLKAEIDAGNIAILCLDMYYVDFIKDPEYRVDKFYETVNAGWGHFIVVKGYKIVDGNVFFETYDPYSLSRSYVTGGLKGRDRYYSGANLATATNTWWPYAIIVEPRGTPEGGRKGVDIDQIVHMPGR